MFESRQKAGQKLAEALQFLKGKKALVLAIPRGGVVVAKSVAQSLKRPLGVLVTRKIGAPDNPELAIGAVGPDKIRLINWDLVKKLRISQEFLSSQIEEKAQEIKERQKRYGQTKLEVEGKTVVLIDDGLATGATVEAAILWLKTKKAGKIILAVPVAPPEVVKKLKSLVDKLVVLETPRFFGAVGQFYKDFPQISDEEVIRILGD